MGGFPATVWDRLIGAPDAPAGQQHPDAPGRSLSLLSRSLPLTFFSATSVFRLMENS